MINPGAGGTVAGTSSGAGDALRAGAAGASVSLGRNVAEDVSHGRLPRCRYTSAEVRDGGECRSEFHGSADDDGDDGDGGCDETDHACFDLMCLD